MKVVYEHATCILYLTYNTDIVSNTSIDMMIISDWENILW